MLAPILTQGSYEGLEWIRNRVGLPLDQKGQLGGHTHARTWRPEQGMAGAEGMFQKYIANAPEGATVPAPERTHVSCGSALVYSGWEKKLVDGDPEYIKRPGPTSKYNKRTTTNRKAKERASRNGSTVVIVIVIFIS